MSYGKRRDALSASPEVIFAQTCKAVADDSRNPVALEELGHYRLIRMHLLYGLGRVLRVQGLALKTSGRTKKQGKQLLAVFEWTKEVVLNFPVRG